MASDYWNVPLADLESIKSNLESMSNDLQGVEDGAREANGVDDIHGFLISQAVDDFYHDWRGSRRVLIENIEKLGMVSGAIAEGVRKFDTEVASGLDQFGAALRGEGGQ